MEKESKKHSKTKHSSTTLDDVESADICVNNHILYQVNAKDDNQYLVC